MPSRWLGQLENATRLFYDWESRGRGWQVWPTPVELEPPFRRLIFKGLSAPPDDGRRQTAVSALLSRLFGRPDAPPPQEPQIHGDPEPEPFADRALSKYVVALPQIAKVSPEAVAQFLLSLRAMDGPCAFELWANASMIQAQFVCPEEHASVFRAQLQTHLPEATLQQVNSKMNADFDESDAVGVVDFGLTHEFMLPLAIAGDFTVDPLAAVCAAFEDLHGDDACVFQVLFQETVEPWSREALWALGDGEGGSFFLDAPNMLSLAQEKLARPLFAVVIRVMAAAETEERVLEILRSVGSVLGVVSNPAGNNLAPLTNDNYPVDDHIADVLARRSRRSGMLLNVDELVTLVHPPSASVQVGRLKRVVKKTRPAPTTCVGHEFVLGTNTHAGKSVSVSLRTVERLRHSYVIGASGTGKSTLLLNMILQDINAGAGCALLDPHADLVDQVLERIPENRLEDVVLLDAADEAYPVGFNILQAHSESEKNLLASDLVEAFKRLSTSWGDQMTSVLGNAILAVLESSRGGTLADLRRFLVEPDFREQYLESVQDREIIYYWRKEFPMLTGRPQAPLLTRLDTFLRPKLIRAMVSQKHDRLDFRWMMDSRKIFLGKLTQGAIGEENSYLLGTLLVTKLHQAALGRQNVPEAQRTPFFLYLDEFHNFVTPSMASILSGARKFGLGLILSHQELRQVAGHDADVASAMIANPYTRICFRLGDDDAKRLQSGFSSFDAKDLQSLGVGEAIVRLERAENDFTLETKPLPVPPPDAADRRNRAVTLSRQKFARTREDVERDQAAAREPIPGKEVRPPRRSRPPKRS